LFSFFSPLTPPTPPPYITTHHHNQQVMVRAGGNSNRTSGSVLQRANFDEETTRRLEAFRVGGADAKRPW
jgi:hypothetical protein